VMHQINATKTALTPPDFGGLYEDSGGLTIHIYEVN